MRQTVRLVACALALSLGLGINVVGAQEKSKTLTTVGAVSKIVGDKLTVDAGKDGIVDLVTTAATQVKVTGGSTKARAAKEAGEKGVKITDLVHEGDQVSVKYSETGGKKIASSIDVLQRRPASAQPAK